MAATAMVIGFSCADESASSDPILDWMMANSSNYIEDARWRRTELEDSMWRPELPYARKRLSAYALPAGGWDLLGEFDIDVQTVGSNPTDVWVDPVEPVTLEGWIALGERVFWYAPMRRDGYLKWLQDKPEFWEQVGLQTDEEGNLRGVVKYTDPRGDERLAVTCGACHGDQGVAGAANPVLDLGRGRALFGEANGMDNSAYGSWGPGTVDVTDDGQTDPLAIPNLWNVDKQTYINHSASVKLSSPAALAIRFETQYIEGQSLIERPPRTLTWALAMFVYNLEAGTQPAKVPNAFDRRCGGCHVGETAFGGALIDASTLNSDPAAANSPLRGTGFYKASTLIGASNAGRFMHDGSFETLEQVLDSGHPYGEPLSESEYTEIIKFLNTL